MAEDNNVQVDTQSSSTTSESNNAVTQTVATEQAPKEKTLTQTEVNELVGRLKREAYERGTRDTEARINSQSQPNHQQSNVQGQAVDEEKMRLARLAAKEEANLANGQRILNEFTQKLMTAKESGKYPDFEEKLVQLNLPSVPHLIGWANSLDNTAEVLYEIANNPGKFAEIMMVSQTSPQLAANMLQKISKSIKDNEEAAKQPKAQEPLSQLKPSKTGTDNGSMSIKDLRKQSWLKG